MGTSLLLLSCEKAGASSPAAADHTQESPAVLSQRNVFSPHDHGFAITRPDFALAVSNRADIARATHFIHKARKGRHAIRCIQQGREERWDADERTVHFAPATGDSFTTVCAAQHEYQGVAFAIPRGHLRAIADAENLKPCSSLRRILTHDDVVLESCMDQLMAPARPDGDAEDLRKDEVARRLVLRLFELSGAGTPDWNDDASIFDRRTLLGLTAYVDEHLRIAPSLSDLCIRVGSRGYSVASPA